MLPDALSEPLLSLYAIHKNWVMLLTWTVWAGGGISRKYYGLASNFITLSKELIMMYMKMPWLIGLTITGHWWLQKILDSLVVFFHIHDNQNQLQYLHNNFIDPINVNPVQLTWRNSVSHAWKNSQNLDCFLIEVTFLSRTVLHTLYIANNVFWNFYNFYSVNA